MLSLVYLMNFLMNYLHYPILKLPLSGAALGSGFFIDFRRNEEDLLVVIVVDTTFIINKDMGSNRFAISHLVLEIRNLKVSLLLLMISRLGYDDRISANNNLDVNAC